MHSFVRRACFLTVVISGCGGGSSQGPPPLSPISIVSENTSGTSGSDDSTSPSSSLNGRYISFSSYAPNLVEGDNNDAQDIFLRDMDTGVLTRASIAYAAGSEGNADSDASSMSADGLYVVFQSSASNLVINDTNGCQDIFLYETSSGITSRVSVASAGTEGNGSSRDPSISADGRYVVFESNANDLVAGDTGIVRDVFLYARIDGDTTRISMAWDGQESDNNSGIPDISGDGQIIVFESLATNLVPDDGNGVSDIFAYDTISGTISRVSVSESSEEGDGSCYSPSISDDGNYVTFQTTSANLVAGTIEYPDYPNIYRAPCR